MSCSPRQLDDGATRAGKKIDGRLNAQIWGSDRPHILLPALVANDDALGPERALEVTKDLYFGLISDRNAVHRDE